MSVREEINQSLGLLVATLPFWPAMHQGVVAIFCSHSWAHCSAVPKQNKAMCSTLSNQPTSLPTMSFLWTVFPSTAGSEWGFYKPMVEHELDRRMRLRQGSTLKGPRATEIRAHNRGDRRILPERRQGLPSCQELEHHCPELMEMHKASPCALEETTVGMTRSEVSPRATGCEAMGPMSHAKLGLSRHKVAYLQTMPSFLGILYGEMLGRQVLGDCNSAPLHSKVLPSWETHDHPSRVHT